MFAARLLGCEGDGSAGVRFGGGVVMRIWVVHVVHVLG